MVLQINVHTRAVTRDYFMSNFFDRGRSAYDEDEDGVEEEEEGSGDEDPNMP